METKSLSLKSQSGHYAHINITVAFASINIASTVTFAITVRTNSMEIANTSAIAYSNIIAIFVTTATRTTDISVMKGHLHPVMNSDFRSTDPRTSPTQAMEEAPQSFGQVIPWPECQGMI
ncbi:hypothetical protein J1605_007819 [Eschrichtius robustus]|uniref:Uncharacterized protein n=1 Tax=Eschrichtius robustus TaxID=9764 RepID=A0AB34GPC2_ESCRO|nr:hypothetical protein J1605_011363 [Eschrichtius robustus]KAJ8784792.1 hypothetical protein J1605_007819 [Eschrichtius robustus]